MSKVLDVVTECWHSRSEARPTSSQVNKLLNKLLSNSSLPFVDKNGRLVCVKRLTDNNEPQKFHDQTS